MKKAAFIFPGQGSQYQGMGKKHYDNYEMVHQIYEEASDVIGIDMKKLCFDTNFAELTQTKNAQPAIFITSYAAYKVFMEEGLEPSFMAGHSLGEISALACSEAISFSDAIKIVKTRGQIMQNVAEQSIGSMYAITRLEVDVIKNLCEKYSTSEQPVVISNYNSPEQIIISGDKEAIAKLLLEVVKNNGKYTELKVSAPFHSPLMNNAASEFAQELKKYTFHDFKYPVVSNVTAKPYNSSDEIIDTLSKHIISPVLWIDVVDYFVTNKVGMTVEIGPQNVLTKLVQKCNKQLKAFAYDDEKGLDLLKTYVNDYKKKPTVVTMCLTIAVCVPNQNWDDNEYKKGVIEPYKRIRKIQAAIDNDNREPSKEEISEAYDMLKSVFKTKKVSEAEQKMRFEQIYDMTGYRESISNYDHSKTIGGWI